LPASLDLSEWIGYRVLACQPGDFLPSDAQLAGTCPELEYHRGVVQSFTAQQQVQIALDTTPEKQLLTYDLQHVHQIISDSCPSADQLHLNRLLVFRCPQTDTFRLGRLIS